MSIDAGFQDTLPPDKLSALSQNSAAYSPEMLKLYQQYCRDGFLIHDFGFDPALIDACAAVTKSLLGKYRRVQDLWRQEQAVRELACAPQVRSFLTSLYRRRAFPFQTLNFPVGTKQRTHSDSYFFNACPERYMCGVWVALEDITIESGPLHYFVGSHELPIATQADIDASATPSYLDYFPAMAKPYKKQLGLIKKGQAIIWSANLLHGGEPVKDPSCSRLSQVNHYYFDDCLYFTPANVHPETGKAFIRSPYDVSQNRFVKSRMNGKIVPANWKYRLQTPFHNLVKYCPKD